MGVNICNSTRAGPPEVVSGGVGVMVGVKVNVGVGVMVLVGVRDGGGRGVSCERRGLWQANEAKIRAINPKISCRFTVRLHSFRKTNVFCKIVPPSARWLGFRMGDYLCSCFGHSTCEREHYIILFSLASGTKGNST